MRKVFILDSKPFSINAMYYSDAHTKTSEFREWTAKIFHQLNSESNLLKFKELRELFDPKKHDISVHLTAFYPLDLFITRENILSSRTIDCSNWEKPLIDLFFDKQYFAKPDPYGCENLNINDKHITRLFSNKTVGDKNQLKISIKIVPRKVQRIIDTARTDRQ